MKIIILLSITIISIVNIFLRLAWTRYKAYQRVFRFQLRSDGDHRYAQHHSLFTFITAERKQEAQNLVTFAELSHVGN